MNSKQSNLNENSLSHIQFGASEALIYQKETLNVWSPPKELHHNSHSERKSRGIRLPCVE